MKKIKATTDDALTSDELQDLARKMTRAIQSNQFSMHNEFNKRVSGQPYTILDNGQVIGVDIELSSAPN